MSDRLKLRDYQLDLMSRVRDMLRRHRAVICQSATGSGKTALAVYMMARAQERGLRSMFCVHRRELIDQTSHALWNQTLQHGLIMPGRSKSPMLAQVASIQTLVRRLDQYPAPDLIVIDEAHRAAAPTYQRIMAAWPGARVVGLTATPRRTDGRGLREAGFTSIVCGPPTSWLIEEGWLSDYVVYAPGQPAVDLSGVHTSMGDYVRDELAAAVDKPTITGDAIREYQRHAAGRRAIVFCVSRKHSRHVCEQFRASGISAEHVDGDTPDADRRDRLDRFRRGETLVLCGVDLFIEGLDIPQVEASILLRPTKSLIVHLQSIGRVLRPSDGKDRAIILDHVANTLRPELGLPDDPRDWTLDGRTSRRKKSESEVGLSVRQCPRCFAVHRLAAACPHCGHVYEGGREIEQRDGELVEISRARVVRERKREQGRARTIEDLAALGVRRGMRKPAAWAAITAAAREQRKPTPDEFRRANDEVRRIMQEAAS